MCGFNSIRMRCPAPLFTSFDDILSRYTGATKTKMDTGGDCATQATTMFTTVQTLSLSKLATIKSGNAVYAALLETPRGQYLEAASAVMNHDGEVGETSFSEPDCSPHPFDVMAIYALYQTVPQVSISGPAQGRRLTSVTLTANASRGTLPYTYEWSTPGWSLTFAPNDRASSVSITLPDISGTDPVEQRTVTVMVTVTDANGKVVRDKHEVVVNP